MTHTKSVKTAQSEKTVPAVTLWVPDFLNPLRIKEASDALSSLKLPVLQTLLAKADRFEAKPQSLDEQASYLFHQPKALAKAAIMASVAFEDYDPSVFWLRVDPVQMIADRDSLVLIPGADIGISEAESRALLEAFNQHFVQDQVVLEYASATAWYMLKSRHRYHNRWPKQSPRPLGSLVQLDGRPLLSFLKHEGVGCVLI